LVRARGLAGLLRASGSFGDGEARVRVDALLHGFRSGWEERTTPPLR
jgi:hypothetical protein